MSEKYHFCILAYWNIISDGLVNLIFKYKPEKSWRNGLKVKLNMIFQYALALSEWCAPIKGTSTKLLKMIKYIRQKFDQTK